VTLPVLVGVGRLTQRAEEPGDGLDAVGLMTEATRIALTDAGSSKLAARVGLIAVPRGTWSCTDPARVVAERIGAAAARSVASEVGVLQHSLITMACEQIASGEIDAAIVCGGEAKHRAMRALLAGVAVDEEPGPAAPPDGTLRPDGELVSSFDIERGIVMPAVQYAMVSSAYAHAAGWTPDEHATRLGALWSHFAQAAARDPQAWDRTAPDADAIVTPSERNRMVATPFTKLLCSQWNVDQAASLVFASERLARELGLDPAHALYPVSSVESNAMIPLPQRRDIHRWPAFRLAAKRALGLATLALDDIDALELYSCFPSAVLVQMNELGLQTNRALTVTGGMTFGGGPLNNFVLQSTVAMAEVLRSTDATTGLVTGVSGHLTKPGVTVWSTDASPDGFASDDVTADALRATPTRPLAIDETGSATIVGATVSHGRDEPARAIAIVELEDGSRTVASSEDPDDVRRATTTDVVGGRVDLTGPGAFRGLSPEQRL
jgi:acetyl-CoA C-acetyltransferase